jgi:hypothetical protein
VLLLLRDYLCASARPQVAEAACVEMGRALAQVEHVLRGSRVSLWGWPAVQAMDALVQVYAELAKQVCCPFCRLCQVTYRSGSWLRIHTFQLAVVVLCCRRQVHHSI